MTERGVKNNPELAAELYDRGVGAARGGQRRVAAILLSRAVQCDPKHEQAWLWLSGVLDEPKEIAFCLRAVLSINPNNDRARQGLVWLEQRNGIALQPAAPSAPAASDARSHDDRRRDREGWWVGWRRNRREISRAWQLIWVGIIVLLTLTLGLNWSLRDAVARSIPLPTAQTSVAVVPGATPLPTAVPILRTQLGSSNDAQALAYLSALDPMRARLRTAVASYREATSKLGNSSVLHATAARNLREQIASDYDALAALRPPPALAAAHTSYLAGLDEERAALDDMLEFYGSFSIQLVNRAVLRLENANQQLGRARLAFTTIGQQANSIPPPAQTLR